MTSLVSLDLNTKVEISWKLRQKIRQQGPPDFDHYLPE
jgi:hypothetical protein